ncbi:hypothetical protein N7470_007844 [Penicillium chermesinum]|nr:hypothetical protein N7470_007844 [Penicillium chermesinum]
MPSPENVRRMILTASVVSITIAGTLYGAGLKTNQEIEQTKRKRHEATFDEKMAALQECGRISQPEKE